MTVLELPGFADTHSHVFHRALRGRTQAPGEGSFWTWREQMYALAGVLDPDLLHRLARAAYAELALAGVTSVGEFHYLHHGPDGAPYDDPNAMGDAVVAAARDAGLRICLLDTCYLAAGFDRPVDGVQRRFSDGSADAWVARVDDLRSRHVDAADVVVGAAVHSVRAVPEDQLSVVAGWAREHDAPLHVHLSEQPAENDACLAAHGVTPTALLDRHGVWGPLTTAVHATHLTADDVAVLGTSGTWIGVCPTTERDLADGVGPVPALRDAGSRFTLGSDGHAVVDPFEQMRAVELDERLVSGRRGTFGAGELLRAATEHGHASLGLAPSGTVRVDWAASPRLAGSPVGVDAAVFAATAADVVRDPDADARVARDLEAAITACWDRVDA